MVREMKSRNLNFVKKTYDDIFLEMLTDAYTEGLLSSDENFLNYVSNREYIENFFILDLSVIALQLTEAYEDMELIYTGLDLSKAKGHDLDNIGKWMGLIRPPAQFAHVELYANIDEPIDDDIFIPVGTRIINNLNNGNDYELIEPIEIVAGLNQNYVTARSLVAGYEARIGENELTEIEYTSDDGFAKKITITNPKSSTGGRPEATDEEYRSLLKNRPYTYKRGTKATYDEFFRFVEGLKGYYLDPRLDGSGTVRIVIDPNTPFMIENISDQLNENVVLYDDDILVTGAIEKTIDIDLIANVDLDAIIPMSRPEKDILEQKLTNALKTYINGGILSDGTIYDGSLIGQDFLPYKAGNFIGKEYDQVKNLDFDYPKEPIVIGADEKAVAGTINVKVV